MNGGCTIVSPNYLPFARVLATSYKTAHPDHMFFVLIVADVNREYRFDSSEPFTPVPLYQLDISNLDSLAFRYDILELNTNVKPTFLKHLLRKFDLEALVYLDPDIYVYSQLTPVFAELERSSIVLIPHITSPILDDLRPSEISFLVAGTYNLGFIAVKNTPETVRFLNWWEARCLAQGFSDPSAGLFVDQKWINLAPCLFNEVAICKDAGCNVSYWNLHERCISGDEGAYVVNGACELRFYHFSGIVVDDAKAISKYTDRYTLATRPELTGLFAGYRHRLRQAERDVADQIPYGFDRFESGEAITSLLRRVYSSAADHYPGNPFDTAGTLYRVARRRGLIGKKQSESVAKSSWNDYRRNDIRVRAILGMLKIALRILGPDRYSLLMKFLRHIALLRNQTFLLMK